MKFTRKYDPLNVFLKNLPHNIRQIVLSFANIELILRESLPSSSYKYPQFWENQSDCTNRPHANAWQSAGFIAELDSMKNEVKFKRV